MQKFFEVLVVISFFALVGIMFIEWLAGCGESYVDAEGIRHVGQCVFVR